MNVLYLFLISDVGFWTVFGAISTFLAALGTITAVYVTRRQLRGLSETSKADFLHRLKSDFFTADSEEILFLIEHNLLEFMILETKDPNDEEMAIFKPKKDKHKLMKSPKHNYTTTEVDRLILGNLEDVGIFEKKKLIDIDSVYEEFSEYIERAWSNEAIRRYVKWTIDEDYDDTYSNFRYIYEKCVSYGKVKRLGKNVLLWKIKFWIKENVLRI